MCDTIILKVILVGPRLLIVWRTHLRSSALPGVKKDGSSCHYFHKPSMAYTTGTRKRRKIQTDDVVDGGADVRWHKTGKTRPVQQVCLELSCDLLLK